jgi:hypothetical protein
MIDILNYATPGEGFDCLVEKLFVEIHLMDIFN